MTESASWHAVLPYVSYATLIVTAALLRTTPQLAWFVIAAVALGLLLIGIHNAWDSVTHIVVSESPGDPSNTD